MLNKNKNINTPSGQLQCFSELLMSNKVNKKRKKEETLLLFSVHIYIYALELDNLINIINCFQSIFSFLSDVVSDVQHRVAHRQLFSVPFRYFLLCFS